MPLVKVESYKTADGQLFPNKKLAIEHELKVTFIEAADRDAYTRHFDTIPLLLAHNSDVRARVMSLLKELS